MRTKITNIVSALFGLLLINGGLNKYLNYMPIPPDLPEPVMKDNAAIMEIAWLLPLVGMAEMVGGLLTIIPKTRALGVLIVFPVMVGVLLTHLTVAPEGLPIAAVIWAIMIWLIFENRQRYIQLIK